MRKGMLVLLVLVLGIVIIKDGTCQNQQTQDRVQLEANRGILIKELEVCAADEKKLEQALLQRQLEIMQIESTLYRLDKKATTIGSQIEAIDAALAKLGTTEVSADDGATTPVLEGGIGDLLNKYKDKKEEK